MFTRHLPHKPRPGRRPAQAAAAILLAANLAGCSYIPWFGGEKDPTPPTALANIVPEVTATTLWSTTLTKGSEDRRLALVPAIGGGRVYVADARGKVVAANANTGRVLWEQNTKLPLSAGPELTGDHLILATNNGLVIALSTADGKEQWRAQVSGEVLAVPRSTGDGKVIVHTLDDTIFGLDEAKGTELWRATYPAPILTLRGSSTPVIVPNGVIVGLAGGKLVKLDTTDGAPLWEVIITAPSGRSELARIADIDADPVVVGRVVLVGTYNGDLAAVDLEGGTVQWRRKLSSHAGLAATETSLFITDSQDLVWGADPVSGAARWKQERLRYRQLTAPTLTGNLIAVGDLEGWLHLIAQTDGRLVGRTRIAKHAITTRPILAGGRLYVYATDGTLAALTTGTAPGGAARGGSAQAAAAGNLDLVDQPLPTPRAAPTVPVTTPQTATPDSPTATPPATPTQPRP
ncbi:outer membrane protein assembly factor BamB [uncultured Thiodictyon sp.]|uniref:outer membrane protein assembly factor BamB n=1 Tax=uncultured Thiodictyon sp. TaxID=1846217 RepID=UPI0025EEC775|nr:outer membrane protein assembly factor BamB [uncultured Thiodictyon sp.]